jgi:hypothetical protein
MKTSIRMVLEQFKYVVGLPMVTCFVAKAGRQSISGGETEGRVQCNLAHLPEGVEGD